MKQLALCIFAAYAVASSCARSSLSRNLTLDPESINCNFTATITGLRPEFLIPLVNPLETAVETTGGCAGLDKSGTPFKISGFGWFDNGFLKKYQADSFGSESMWVDFHIQNLTKNNYRDISVTIKSKQKPFADLSTDTTNTKLHMVNVTKVGQISQDGIGSFRIGVPMGRLDSAGFDIEFTATVAPYTAKNSSNIINVGGEIWSVVPENNVISVIDEKSNSIVGSIATAAPAYNLASDGTYIFASLPTKNQLVTIAKASKQIVSTVVLSEAREPRGILLSSDQKRLYVSSFVDDKVTEWNVDPSGNLSLNQAFATGRRPLGLSTLPDNDTVLVSHLLPQGLVRENFAFVSVIHAATKRIDIVKIEDSYNPLGGAKCIVARTGLNPETYADSLGEAVPTGFFGVFADESGSRIWLPGSPLMPMPVWEGNTKNIKASGGRGAFGYGVTWLLDARNPQLIVPLASPVVANYPEKSRAFADCYKPKTIIESLTPVQIGPINLELFINEPQGSTPFSEISRVRAIAFSSGSRRAFMLGYGSDEMMVVDGTTMNPISQKHFQLPGSQPHGIVLSQDGSKAFISYANSVFVSAINVSSYQAAQQQKISYAPFSLNTVRPFPSVSATTNAHLVRLTNNIPMLPAVSDAGRVDLVATDAYSPVLRLGKTLFSSSNPAKNPRISRTRGASCETCHVDGGNDGSGWSTVEGERRTTSLRGGLIGRGWLHASGTHRDIGTFADVIVSERMGGTGLNPNEKLALQEYVAKGNPKLQAPSTNATMVAAGKAVFEQKCQGCHSSVSQSSGRPMGNSEFFEGDVSGPTLFPIFKPSQTSWILVANPKLLKQLPPEMQDVIEKIRGDRALGAGDTVEQILEFEKRPNRASGEVKAPSLTNVFDQGLYFHNASTVGLKAAIQKMYKVLGQTPSEAEVDNVHEYLKTL